MHAIVTGGSRGIGQAIAAGLARAGCDVLLVARNAVPLQQAAARLTAETGRDVRFVAADLSTPEGTAMVAARAAQQSTRLDVLVNNAGATARGTLFEVTEQDWADGFALKFHGAARLTRALWPALAAAGGSVVNIAGVAGRTPTADFVVGSAVNAAVMSLTKSLAEQGATDGVRVNCINPGLINTDRLRRRVEAIAARDGGDMAAAERTLAKEWGITRIGQPEEIAALAVFLAIGGGTYCQGGIFDVDGGRTRSL
jgi:3-oxoacyl-[acyl-carrier protein] reductase